MAQQAPRATEFLDGSPISNPSNPYNQGEVFGGRDSNDALSGFANDPAPLENERADFSVDMWGSQPVTDDTAAGRPVKPHSL
jgi:hypothetical protein